MQNDLLDEARIRAEKAEPGVRAAAFLRIARASAAGEISRAREMLREGLNATAALASPERDHLFEEAREVTAAIDPDLLAEIPVSHFGISDRFVSGHVVQVMLAHGHVDAALQYLLRKDDPASFPFPWLGNVLHELEKDSSTNADRRLVLLRRAVDMWSRSPSGPHHHERNDFVRLFGVFWKEFPEEEARAIAGMIVDQAKGQPDTGTSAGYMNEIHFSSPRQNTLFQIFHVLRHLDPILAQTLTASHDQLAVAIRRYSNGLETMNEEAAAEAERRKANGPSCEGGYMLIGNPKDFGSQRRLIDASRDGDFAPSIQDALDKYLEDTSLLTPNHAPKEYWPSTGAFRMLFYQAAKRLGREAEKLLDQIPDDDLRLFATIELAAALAGVPGSSIRQMKQPRPAGLPRPLTGRVISSQVGTDGPTMQSPDRRLIRCPKCLFHPPADLRWNCKCGHVWNTFWTSGRCPACHFQWETTQCPSCGEGSEHRAWYVGKQ